MWPKSKKKNFKLLKEGGKSGDQTRWQGWREWVQIKCLFQEYKELKGGGLGTGRFDGAPLEFPSRLVGSLLYDPAHVADLSSLRLI